MDGRSSSIAQLAHDELVDRDRAVGETGSESSRTASTCELDQSARPRDDHPDRADALGAEPPRHGHGAGGPSKPARPGQIALTDRPGIREQLQSPLRRAFEAIRERGGGFGVQPRQAAARSRLEAQPWTLSASCWTCSTCAVTLHRRSGTRSPWPSTIQVVCPPVEGHGRTHPRRIQHLETRSCMPATSGMMRDSCRHRPFAAKRRPLERSGLFLDEPLDGVLARRSSGRTCPGRPPSLSISGRTSPALDADGSSAVDKTPLGQRPRRSMGERRRRGIPSATSAPGASLRLRSGVVDESPRRPRDSPQPT